MQNINTKLKNIEKKSESEAIDAWAQRTVGFKQQIGRDILFSKDFMIIRIAFHTSNFTILKNDFLSIE